MTDILHREIELACTPSEAWESIVDPSWLGDEGEWDATPGGEGWVSTDGETRYLVTEEVEEGQRLVYRWATFQDPPSRVEIELEPLPYGTRITVTETPLEAKAQLLYCAS
jgi:uncharacterized protein YndB with AHSA1/START domain